jgi:hypothetical protein
LALLLALAPRASATEVLQNGSFADGTNNWQRSPELAAWVLIWLPTWPDWSPVVTNNVILHPVHGFLGPIVFQDLNVPNVASADLIATITLSKFSGPAGPTNSIAVYADYVDADGLTNRILLQNPADSSVSFGPPTTVTNMITLPSSARTLVRYTIARLESGVFESSGVGLDVSAGGGTQELGLSIVDMWDGDTNTPPIALRAGVTNLTASVSNVVFYANGIPVGNGSLDPHGEWAFSDGTHLSVMSYNGNDMVDYSPPSPAAMYFMHGQASSLYNFSGMFMTWAPDLTGGPVIVVYTVSPEDQLTVAITAAAPLGNLTLTNGVRDGDIKYGYFWQNAAPGQYAITARAVYNGSLSATSAPVNITVLGVVPIPPLHIRQTTPTQVELSWADNGVGYLLNMKTNLTAPYWESAPGSQELIGGHYLQTITATNRTGFFSLQKL